MMKHKVKVKKSREYAAPKPGKNIDVDALPDAIINGFFVATQNDVLILSRPRYSGPMLSYCTAMRINDDGTTFLYDDSLKQEFMFNLNDKTLPVLKIYMGKK